MSPALLLALFLGADALPDRAQCRRTATAQPWGRDLRQIPSTVIDAGILRNVPYTSYRASEYEVNVYGDPAKPACVEVGTYRDVPEARRNCQAFVMALLGETDRKTLESLRLETGKKVRDGRTIEITPPSAADAYGAWWISVYDESALEKARATPGEMKKLTLEASDARDDLAVDPLTAGRWGREDLAYAREGKGRYYSPVFVVSAGGYTPDRTVDDTGWILFICANSDKHEDREVLLKSCLACKKASTFYWETDRFLCFQCGKGYENSLIKCPECGKVPRRVRTKHR